jgi:putative ABC transport system substrate-binding protein
MLVITRAVGITTQKLVTLGSHAREPAAWEPPLLTTLDPPRLEEYMNTLRIFLSGLVIAALLTGCQSQTSPGPVIGICQTGSTPVLDEALQGVVDGLTQAGYRDGETATLDIKNGENDLSTIQTIAQKFVSQPVDVIVTLGTPCLQAALKATESRPIPVVFGATANPYRAGAGDSADNHLPHVTGASASSPVAEQLDLVREVLPQADKVGWIWCTAETGSEFYVGLARKRAAELGIELLEANVNTSADVKQAAQSVVARGANAIADGGDNITSSAIDAVIGVAESSGIPFITIYPNLADRGALLAQGWNYVENGRKTAALAARVLEGEDPATIPFQTLDAKKLVVNEAVARRLGLTIPPELLSRAEDVIR